MYNKNNPPLMIGAKGGSGTRAISRITQSLGYNLGSDFNVSSDSMKMVPFILKWHIKCQDLWFNNEVKTLNHNLFLQDWEKTLEGHMGKNVPELWGWKNPQSINMLPFFHELSPGLKFIQVIRDGRDIAFSKNQQELGTDNRGTAMNRWNKSINHLPEAKKSILYWQKINLEASTYAQNNLKNNYYLLKFEDLCKSPIEEIIKISNFLGIPSDDINFKKISKLVSTSTSIGRYKQQPINLISDLEELGKKGLEYFKYF